ncbi:MAG: FkbM family methyltransferase, partial [Alphaproteobacteria bacterium HGW-Alphaproteobacteria-10]
VKIDVEGHEIEALRGAEALIRRDRPDMLIEVADVNRAEIDALLNSFGYRIAATHRRYPENENVLAIPA